MTLNFILKYENNFSKLSKKQLVSMVSFLLCSFLKLKSETEKSKIKDLNSQVNQPSSKKPEFDKGKEPENPKKKKKRKKKRTKNKGCGNKGKTELTPDKTNIIELTNCPDCEADLQSSIGRNNPSRIVEDILPVPEKSEVTEEICVTKWCPICKKMVSSKTEAALPGSDIGLGATVWMAYFWAIIAISLPNIAKYFSSFFKLNISSSGISKLMIRISKILMPIYEEILHEVKAGTVIYADETGWRVCGVLHWLWGFANRKSAFYWPDRSRGSAVVEKILGNYFSGTLVADGWCAYLKIFCAGMKQTCNSHLFRKIRTFRDAYPQYYSILKFYIKFKKIITDGERIKKDRTELGDEKFKHRLELLKNRLHDLLSWEKPNDILLTIIKKIRLQESKILTFVSYEGVDSHNNFAEYIMRKGVLKRKISGGSMSFEGLMAYCVLISIGQTCHMRNLSFTGFLTKSLKAYIRTGKAMHLSEYENELKVTQLSKTNKAA